MAEKRKILEVKNLKKYFPLKKGKYKEGDPCVKAVDDITFDLYEGETLGLVGESGCGKSTLGRTIIRLYEPTSGEVIFEGEDVAKKSRKEMRALREESTYDCIQYFGRTIDCSRKIQTWSRTRCIC